MINGNKEGEIDLKSPQIHRLKWDDTERIMSLFIIGDQDRIWRWYNLDSRHEKKTTDTPMEGSKEKQE